MPIMPKLNQSTIVITIVVILIVVGSLGALVLSRTHTLKIDVTYPETTVEKPQFVVKIYDVGSDIHYDVPFNILNSQTSKTVTFGDDKPNMFGLIDVHVIPPVDTLWNYRLETDTSDGYLLRINVGDNVEIYLWDNNDQHVATLNFIWEFA